jgi:hypothetical protein
MVVMMRLIGRFNLQDEGCCGIEKCYREKPGKDEADYTDCPDNTD